MPKVKKSKIEVIFRALNLGREIEIGGTTYRMVENEFQVKFMINPEWGVSTLEVNDFLYYVDQMTDDEIFLIAAENGLTMINQKDRG